MQELSKQDIKVITETIDRSGISFSHLREDLIDHVCCQIEARLETGASFNQAFKSVKKDLGIKSLQQVQEKTLLLIDKNYSVMKTTMKLTGVFSVVLLIVGTLFKINHWPMAGLLLTLGFFILCVFFLPSAYYIMHKEGKDKRLIALYVSAFIGSAGFFLGILYKIQHWPGANIMLTGGTGVLCLLFFPLLLRYLNRKASTTGERTVNILGILTGILFLVGFLFKFMHWHGGTMIQTVAALFLVILFIPFYTYVKYSKTKKVEASFIYIIVAVSWLSMFTMLVSMSKWKNIIPGIVINMHHLQLQNTDFHDRNENLYKVISDSLNNDNLKKTRTIAEELDGYIRDLKLEIVQNLDPINHQAIDNKGNINMELIHDIKRTRVPFSILIGENQTGKATDLKRKIDATRLELIELVNNDEQITAIITTCLNTNMPKNSPKWSNSWEMLWFSSTSVMGCLEVLTTLQRNLNIAEYEVITYLSNI